MRILALETSTDSGSIALWHDGQIDLRPCPAQKAQSESLIPLVKTMLADAACGFSSLDGIVFDCGPGAFTGLRVACSVAQGFAFAADRPLLGIGSLEILAAQAAEAGFNDVLAALDARMNEVYAALYRNGILHGSIAVLPPDRLDRLLPQDYGIDWAICGNAFPVYPHMASNLPRCIKHFLEPQAPRADTLAALAVPRILRGEKIDPGLASPVYIRDKVANTLAERLSQGGAR